MIELVKPRDLTSSAMNDTSLFAYAFQTRTEAVCSVQISNILLVCDWYLNGLSVLHVLLSQFLIDSSSLLRCGAASILGDC